MRNLSLFVIGMALLSSCTKSVVKPSSPTMNSTGLGQRTLTGPGTNYYVNASTGSDSNTGLSTSVPLKTIQAALNKTTEGAAATINVAAGTYSERITFPHSGASSAAPITVTNYSSGLVYIDGTSTNTGTNANMVTIASKSHVRLNGIIIQNDIMAYANGISVIGSGTDVEINACTIHNIGWTTSMTAVPTSTNNAHALFVEGTGTTGALSYSNVYIGFNTIYSCATGYSEAMTMTGNVNNFLIEHNVVHDITNIGIDMSGYYSYTGAPDSVNYARGGNVNYNTVYNCVSKVATSGGIYVDGGSYINIQGNTCYGNGAGMTVGCENNNYTATQINVRDNFIYNNVTAGIIYGSNQANSKVTYSTLSGNTFYNNYSQGGYGGEVEYQNTDHLNVFDNIIQSRSNVVLIALSGYTSTNLAMDYDDYYTLSASSGTITFDWGGINGGGYYSFATFQSGTGLETNGLYNIPGFTTASLPTPNLHLTSTSACLNRGLPGYTAASGELDIDGQTRVQNSRVDIGADETAY
jgi:hypothetical protein